MDDARVSEYWDCKRGYKKGVMKLREQSTSRSHNVGKVQALVSRFLLIFGYCLVVGGWS
jgi:uncharacterized membrane protein